MSDELIICGEHGETPATFICTHMFDAWQKGVSVGMVVSTPTDDDSWPDAWCDECDQKYQQERDKLTDGDSVSDGIKALCVHCYMKVYELADQAGRVSYV